MVTRRCADSAGLPSTLSATRDPLPTEPISRLRSFPDTQPGTVLTISEITGSRFGLSCTVAAGQAAGAQGTTAAVGVRLITSVPLPGAKAAEVSTAWPRMFIVSGRLPAVGTTRESRASMISASGGMSRSWKRSPLAWFWLSCSDVAAADRVLGSATS